MKKNYLAAAMAYLVLAALPIVSGCKRYEHKKEEKEIKKERSEAEKSTSDLGEAVLITDLAGWDSARDYREFSDTSMKRIRDCNAVILTFKKTRKKDGKVIPVLYKRKISKLEKRSRELEQRLKHYTIKSRPEWEDFTKLFNYDLYQLEQSVKKLD